MFVWNEAGLLYGILPHALLIALLLLQFWRGSGTKKLK